MTDEIALGRFPSDVGKGPKTVARKTIVAARDQGVLGPDDELEAVAVLNKYPNSIVLLGIFPMFALQRNCVLLVTSRHVIFSKWTLYGGAQAVADTCRVDRPVELVLSKEARKEHFFGNRVDVPPKVAEFLRKAAIHASQGLVADEALRVARAPATTAG